MYKFEASFTTLADLVAFTNTLGVAQINKISETQVQNDPFKGQEIPAVIEDKPVAKKPAVKKAQVKEEAVVQEATPSAAPVVAEPSHKQDVTTVQQEVPKASTPVTTPAPFDRASALDIAVRLVAVLKSTGIADNDIMPAIHEVYAQAGCDIALKISQFDDVSLARFIPLFEQRVNAIAAKAKATPESSASFI